MGNPSYTKALKQYLRAQRRLLGYWVPNRVSFMRYIHPFKRSNLQRRLRQLYDDFGEGTVTPDIFIQRVCLFFEGYLVPPREGHESERPLDYWFPLSSRSKFLRVLRVVSKGPRSTREAQEARE